MTELLIIKVGKKEYTITEQDRFLDNGACIQLISKNGSFGGWHYNAIVLPKREVKRIAKFRRVVLNRDNVDPSMLTFRLGHIEKVT
jgi:hypothetical protein